jgi:hypothetical protein
VAIVSSFDNIRSKVVCTCDGADLQESVFGLSGEFPGLGGSGKGSMKGELSRRLR